jgi:aldose 1-epimerase
VVLAAVVGSLFCSCTALSGKSAARNQKEAELTGVSKMGKVNGQQVKLYTLRNGNGMEVKIMNYGGIIKSLRVPDSEGNVDDVVLGFKSLDEYVEKSTYFGTLVGRYANRIAGGKFTLDGRTHELPINNRPGGKPCTLHGGKKGFDSVVWNAEPVRQNDMVGVHLHYTSEDGEQGFPGTMHTTVTYWLTAGNELRVQYRASTDKPTPVNLTQHAYFNLDGEGDGTVLDHRLTLNASHYTPVNEGLIPTGKIAPVEGTPFDFTEPRRIGARIDADHPQIEIAGGYDHNFVLDHQKDRMGLAARVVEPDTGRIMEVYTDQPGVQLYTGNFLDGSLVGKSGEKYVKNGGFCLETQHFPDSPHHPNFPDTILRPGETLETETIFTFSTK